MKWPKVQLDSLTEVDRGITYGVVKPGDEGQVTFVRGGDILQGRIAEDQLRTISSQVSQAYKRTLLSGGELLVSLVGNPGEVAIAPPTLNGANIARQVGLVALRPEVNSRYVMYYLMSPLGRAELFVRTGGAVQQVINLADLKTVDISVPPRAVQDRIAGVLSTYDELIENNRRRMALLEESARLLYQEWFVRLRFPGHEYVRIVDGVPDGWGRRPLKVFCPDLRDSTHPADLEPGTPYIGLEHIPRRSITLLAWGEVEDVTSTKLRYQAGDILFGKIRPYFHKVGFALTDGVASSDAIVLRVIEPAFYAFSLLTVSSDWFVTVASKTAKEGSKMPRADWKLMENHRIAVPPLGLLDSLNEIVLPMLKHLQKLAFQNQKLRVSRDLLLPRLMSGEVAV
jgi:type I restriction enzyme S subunit